MNIGVYDWLNRGDPVRDIGNSNYETMSGIYSNMGKNYDEAARKYNDPEFLKLLHQEN